VESRAVLVRALRESVLPKAGVLLQLLAGVKVDLARFAIHGQVACPVAMRVLKVAVLVDLAALVRAPSAARWVLAVLVSAVPAVLVDPADIAAVPALLAAKADPVDTAVDLALLAAKVDPVDIAAVPALLAAKADRADIAAVLVLPVEQVDLADTVRAADPTVPVDPERALVDPVVPVLPASPAFLVSSSKSSLARRPAPMARPRARARQAASARPRSRSKTRFSTRPSRTSTR